MFNLIKRLVFEKDIFDEKKFNKVLAIALKWNWIWSPFTYHDYHARHSVE